MNTCPDCNGDGVIEKGTDDEEQCPRCGGTGFVPNDNDDKKNEEVVELVLAPGLYEGNDGFVIDWAMKLH